MSRPKRKRYVVFPGMGDPCPKCCQPTQIREHEAVLEKHLRQPFYFRRWFHCTNPKCQVQMYCVERFKIHNGVVWGDSWDGVDEAAASA